MEQRVPDVSEADVVRVVQRDFGPDDAARVESLLREFDPAMSPRVMLAVLKLSEGCLESVRRNLETARRDWRDVIAYAEYPAYMQRVSGPGSVSDAQRDQIVRADWEQYQAWLER